MPVTKVLIANRGEIAVRIARTLRALAIPSVVVFHADEREGLAVREVDAAVEIFGETPVAAYLDGPQIIQAALFLRDFYLHDLTAAFAAILDLVANLSQTIFQVANSLTKLRFFLSHIVFNTLNNLLTLLLKVLAALLHVLQTLLGLFKLLFGLLESLAFRLALSRSGFSTVL